MEGFSWMRPLTLDDLPHGSGDVYRRLPQTRASLAWTAWQMLAGTAPVTQLAMVRYANGAIDVLPLTARARTELRAHPGIDSIRLLVSPVDPAWRAHDDLLRG